MIGRSNWINEQIPPEEFIRGLREQDSELNRDISGLIRVSLDEKQVFYQLFPAKEYKGHAMGNVSTSRRTWNKIRPVLEEVGYEIEIEN